MSYTVEQIAEWMGAERIGSASANVNWILTDSRSLCFPEETLFFALKSQRNDGHKYVQELYKRGVRNFVVSRLPQNMVADDCNFFVVDDTLHALQMLAASHPCCRNNRKQRQDRGERVAQPTSLACKGRYTLASQLQLADWRAYVGMALEREDRSGSVRGRNIKDKRDGGSL